MHKHSTLLTARCVGGKGHIPKIFTAREPNQLTGWLLVFLSRSVNKEMIQLARHHSERWKMKLQHLKFISHSKEGISYRIAPKAWPGTCEKVCQVGLQHRSNIRAKHLTPPLHNIHPTSTAWDPAIITHSHIQVFVWLCSVVNRKLRITITGKNKKLYSLYPTWLLFDNKTRHAAIYISTCITSQNRSQTIRPQDPTLTL
jgi:hypothetical protein